MHRDYGSEYRDLYNRHWWWRARDYIIRDLLSQVQLAKPARILDFGCGDALAFPLLECYGDVYGIEPDHRLVTAGNPYRNRISRFPLPHPSYRGEKFNLITALDVIEHCDDDRTVVTELYEMLWPGGTMLLTVPASMALWDAHDVINQHRRRYSLASLSALVPPSARLVKVRHLFHGLYPIKRIMALVNRCRSQPMLQHVIPPSPLNAIAQMYCTLEYRCCRRFNLPWGTSLYAIIQKPIGTDQERAS